MTISLSTLNCQGFCSNRQMVIDTINHSDISFIIEHWLRPDEETTLSSVSNNHTYFFESDMPAHNSTVSTRGRPFGGRCWCIKKGIVINSHEVITKDVSVLDVQITKDGTSSSMLIIGLWIPFDDGSIEKFASFKSIISLLESFVHNFNTLNNSQCPIIIMGDFNADISRGKRFDEALRVFISSNGLIDGVSEFVQEQLDHTWASGGNKATIDHIIVNEAANTTLNACHTAHSMWAITTAYIARSNSN